MRHMAERGVVAAMMSRGKDQGGGGADGRHDELEAQCQGREKRDGAPSSFRGFRPRPHVNPTAAIAAFQQLADFSSQCGVASTRGFSYPLKRRIGYTPTMT
jgi:hypothetical protein